MVRIFSIEFNYNNAVQRAMITVRDAAFYKEFKISLQNEELTKFLLTDKIISPSPGNYLFANTDVAEYNEFMKLILAAVAGHVHSPQY